MKILKENDIEQFISSEKLRGFYNENIDDIRVNECFARYAFLKTHADIFLLDKSTLYYSIYFWFSQFKQQYSSLIGTDEGFEQEGYKLLEEIDLELDEGIDWNIITSIDNSIYESG